MKDFKKIDSINQFLLYLNESLHFFFNTKKFAANVILI